MRPEVSSTSWAAAKPAPANNAVMDQTIFRFMEFPLASCGCPYPNPGARPPALARQAPGLADGMALRVGVDCPQTPWTSGLAALSDLSRQVGLDTSTAHVGFARCVIGNDGEVNKLFSEK